MATNLEEEQQLPLPSVSLSAPVPKGLKMRESLTVLEGYVDVLAQTLPSTEETRDHELEMKPATSAVGIADQTNNSDLSDDTGEVKGDTVVNSSADMSKYILNHTEHEDKPIELDSEPVVVSEKEIERPKSSEPSKFVVADKSREVDEVDVSRKEFDERVSIAAELLVSGNYSESYNLFNSLLSKHSRDQYKLLKSIVPREEVDIARYLCAVAAAQSKELDAMVKGLRLLNDLSLEAVVPSAMLDYARVKAFLALNRYELARGKIQELLTNLPSMCAPSMYPGTSIVIPESDSAQLKILLEELKLAASIYTKPDAICMLADCHGCSHLYPDRKMYISDLDFKGYVEVRCTEKCRLQYHQTCWKLLRERGIADKHTEKEIIGQACQTPDCVGLINRITSYDQKLQVKYQAIAEAETKEVKKKCAERETEKSRKKAERDKKENRKESEAKENELPGEGVEEDSENEGLVHEIQVPLKKKKKRKAKQLAPMPRLGVRPARKPILGVDEDFPVVENSVSAIPVGAPKEWGKKKRNSHQIDDVNGIVGPVECDEELLKFIRTCFVAYFQENGPLNLCDLGLKRIVTESLPPRAQEFIRCSGGLQKFLLSLPQFNQMEDILYLVEHEARAIERITQRIYNKEYVTDEFLSDTEESRPRSRHLGDIDDFDSSDGFVTNVTVSDLTKLRIEDDYVEAKVTKARLDDIDDDFGVAKHRLDGVLDDFSCGIKTPKHKGVGKSTKSRLSAIDDFETQSSGKSGIASTSIKKEGTALREFSGLKATSISSSQATATHTSTKKVNNLSQLDDFEDGDVSTSQGTAPKKRAKALAEVDDFEDDVPKKADVADSVLEKGPTPLPTVPMPFSDASESVRSRPSSSADKVPTPLPSAGASESVRSGISSVSPSATSPGLSQASSHRSDSNLDIPRSSSSALLTANSSQDTVSETPGYCNTGKPVGTSLQAPPRPPKKKTLNSLDLFDDDEEDLYSKKKSGSAVASAEPSGYITVEAQPKLEVPLTNGTTSDSIPSVDTSIQSGPFGIGNRNPAKFKFGSEFSGVPQVPKITAASSGSPAVYGSGLPSVTSKFPYYPSSFEQCVASQLPGTNLTFSPGQPPPGAYPGPTISSYQGYPFTVQYPEATNTVANLQKIVNDLTYSRQQDYRQFKSQQESYRNDLKALQETISVLKSEKAADKITIENLGKKLNDLSMRDEEVNKKEKLAKEEIEELKNELSSTRGKYEALVKQKIVSDEMLRELRRQVEVLLEEKDKTYNEIAKLSEFEEKLKKLQEEKVQSERDAESEKDGFRLLLERERTENSALRERLRKEEKEKKDLSDSFILRISELQDHVNRAEAAVIKEQQRYYQLEYEWQEVTLNAEIEKLERSMDPNKSVKINYYKGQILMNRMARLEMEKTAQSRLALVTGEGTMSLLASNNNTMAAITSLISGIGQNVASSSNVSQISAPSLPSGGTTASASSTSSVSRSKFDLQVGMLLKEIPSLTPEQARDYADEFRRSAGTKSSSSASLIAFVKAKVSERKEPTASAPDEPQRPPAPAEAKKTTSVGDLKPTAHKLSKKFDVDDDFDLPMRVTRSTNPVPGPSRAQPTSVPVAVPSPRQPDPPSKTKHVARAPKSKNKVTLVSANPTPTPAPKSTGPPKGWQIKQEKEWEGSEDGSCTICFNEIDEKHRRQLPCKHSYHLWCIDQWLQKEASCPICRKYVCQNEEFPALS